MHIGVANRITRPAGETPPALVLDFLRSTLDSRLIFTRASAGTDIVNGVLTSFATDAPRISTANGLMIEEARTNSLPNNGTGGAVVGTLGSGGAYPTNWLDVNTRNLVREIVSTRTENGFRITRVRYSGTPNSTGTLGLQYTANTTIVAANAQTWTTSHYIALVAGSMSNATLATRVNEGTSAGAYINGSGTNFTPNATLTRYTHTRTLSGGGTVARVWGSFDLSVTNGLAVDLTLDIAEPQLEQGAFASSVIQTTSAAATRAADLCSMSPISWFSASEGTFQVEGRTGLMDTAAATSPRLLRVRDSSANNFIELRRQASTRQLQSNVNTATVDQCVLDGGVWNDTTTARAALAYRVNDMAASFAGGSVVSDSSGTMPSGIDTLRIGAGSSTAGFWNGYVRTVRYWNRRLSNSQLQGIST